MNEAHKIAIIIPVLNEEQTIVTSLNTLKERLYNKETPIFIVDGGSSDNTKSIVGAFTSLNITCISCSSKGRAAQMHTGAMQSDADIFYFLHIDSIPPYQFDQIIFEAVKEGHMAGCFRLKFDNNHWLLNASCWFTRFQGSLFRGGDQSLFVFSHIYHKTGGFDTSLPIMEDIEIIHRISKITSFKIIKKQVVTSSRKYDKNGYVRLQLIFGFIHLMWSVTIKPETIKRFYNKFIH